MVERRHYPKAPITEAIIEIRGTVQSATSVASLLDLQRGEEARYPNRHDRVQFSGEFSLGAVIGTSTQQTQNGYIFSSDDGRQVVQASLEGFAFSRTRPYESWEPFRDEARRLWARYRAVTGTAEVVRVAVRYINRIDLPLPLGDFAEYLRTVPEVSPDLPQGLSGYLMQLQMPLDEFGSTLVLNQALLPRNESSVVPILLDIDVFRIVNKTIDDDELWEMLEELHSQEGNAFEACLTDKARELFS